MNDQEPDTETLRRLDALQERNRCPKCGSRPRLQTMLTQGWLETGEVDVMPVKSCDCPTQE